LLQPLVIATRLAWCLALCERQASRYPGTGPTIHGIDIGEAHLAVPGSCHSRPHPTIAGKHDVSSAHPHQIIGTLHSLPAWGPLEAGDVALDVFLQDRKSTRLNSSHRTISYAVFCLKKKKKKNKTNKNI